MKKLELESGIIEEKYNAMDYDKEMLAGVTNNFDDLVKVDFKITNEYHQPDVSNSSCTLFSSIGCESNLFDYRFPTKIIKGLWEEAIKGGAMEGKGRYVYKGVDLIRNYRNKLFPVNKTATFKIENDTELFYQLLELGYPCASGYRGSMERLDDRDDDGDVNEITVIPNPSYGHSVMFYPKDGKVGCLTSYKKTAKYNTYSISNYKKLVKSKTIFKYSYFFIPLDNFKMPNDEAVEKLNYESALKLAKEVGISNCDNLEKTCSRGDAIVMSARVYKLLNDKIEKLENKIKILK